MSKSSKLVIRFDVEDSRLPLGDYITALSAIKNCIDGFEGSLLETLDYTLYVYPEEHGSFTSKILIVAAFITILDADIIKHFIEGTTGKNLNEVSRDIGKAVTEEFLPKIFEIPNDELQKIIPDEIDLQKSLKAKSDFYIMCSHNNDIKGVGFGEGKQFPIQRSDFHRHILPPDDDKTNTEYRLYKDAIIISPVDVDKDDAWRLRIAESSQMFWAKMRDDGFKKAFLGGDYPLKTSQTPDRMTILVESETSQKEGKPQTKRYIKEVYSFNDHKIKDIPPDIEKLQATQEPTEDAQTSLFD